MSSGTIQLGKCVLTMRPPLKNGTRSSAAGDPVCNSDNSPRSGPLPWWTCRGRALRSHGGNKGERERLATATLARVAHHVQR